MRQKRSAKQMRIERMGRQGMFEDPTGANSKLFGRFTKVRTKDQVRSRVAFARKRVGGLFVSKKRELELQDVLSGDSDTDDPD